MAANRIIDSPRAIKLSDYDPDDTNGMKHKDATAAQQKLEARLSDQQDLLYGAGHQSVLIILQGMDTSGKDGTVKHVLQVINPAGCHVWSFKVPTPEEAAHDFLWRIHQRTPARGMVGVFNRSQYEDVLVARVHSLVPREIWQERYAQIDHFEQMLAQNDTIIFKFFLHISKDEQRQRLLAREDDPTKSWKLSVSDWQERAYRDAYQEAYQDAIGKCASEQAPWYIVPANKKWYRNLFILQTLVARLEPYERAWSAELAERGKEELAALRKAKVHEE
jgi:PPK2 family polyphosphate:nucleotide phosphotransferase